LGRFELGPFLGRLQRFLGTLGSTLALLGARRLLHGSLVLTSGLVVALAVFAGFVPLVLLFFLVHDVALLDFHDGNASRMPSAKAPATSRKKTTCGAGPRRGPAEWRGSM